MSLRHFEMPGWHNTIASVINLPLYPGFSNHISIIDTKDVFCNYQSHSQSLEEVEGPIPKLL